MGVTSVIEPLAPPVGVEDPLEQRVVAAMLDCIARWGIAKTTADDVARTAGVSRATLYRTFPGGKDVVFDTVLRHEAARFFRIVTEDLSRAPDLEDRLVVGIVSAARFLSQHESLGYVMANEPERVLPELTFDHLGRTLGIATAFAAPHLREFVADDDTALARAEWIVRLLLSYATNPSPRLALTDEAAVRRFVTTYVLPAFEPTHEAH